MFGIGRVCIKTAGREEGNICCIVKKIDDKFVEVTGPRQLTRVKRRRCNIEHLKPTEIVLKIKADAPDSDVINAYKKEGVLEKLGMTVKDIKVAEKKISKAEKSAKMPKQEKLVEKKVKEKKKAEPKKVAKKVKKKK